MATKKSTRAAKRAALIKQGKCGTCGKRPLAKGHKECRACLDYYAGLANAARKTAEARREKRKAQKAAWAHKNRKK